MTEESVVAAVVGGAANRTALPVVTSGRRKGVLPGGPASWRGCRYPAWRR